MSFWQTIGRIYESSVFVYGTVLLFIYAMLAVFSMIAVRAYARKDKLGQGYMLNSSPLAPGITVLAPAYNEGLTIIYNVRSLLTLNYPKYEIIIINDGSTDNSLEQLITEFDLVQVDFAYNVKIKTQPVRKIFKSTNPAYAQLMIIDKVNGKSKADAVNAGINAASYNYFLCTDVDCILDKNTLLELIKPVMQEGKKRVIATGATLRIANSCEFDQGVMTRMRPPRQLLPRFQEVEYIRAFVLGKMGWSLLNCVPNVSGGLGLFDKEVAIRSGGYDHSSFGEDMELMTRMCRYAHDNKINYAIRYIPKTLCWTEAPESVKIFNRQRTRWARGLAQLMFSHFGMFLNPRYGKMGLIIFPYNFFFELLAPLVEITGIIYYIIMICLGQINWPTAVMLLVFVYTYSVMITTIAILWDQLTFRYYRTWKEVAYLCMTPFMEFFLYHPLIVLFSLRGYYYFLTGKKSTWGNMQRRGFRQNVPGAKTAAV
ncbi:Glycosyltransferase, catalytic subunit of cellulose synthase and poly-beta-1,6-N-acetylglucosamine synthase [Chitinophaga rupis]|uniref:Glycosyltransferase, catalytic subunit of cellulose synthase and poly-beta-1,6-N-acetylglucosamine synthase n=1 Tax=Chitinophaga rupis TaxID=573321 RepID=A0A1H7Y6L3_9BACT|nr:glycosyltransferase [Chitinophaga rupis]SEM41760.1 Glycosyltransferase, catalytic subunit of cellulose synthase and poly-beta-1,6-N-acetylglucosamine synthase [Chitinophaga rupis]